MPLADYVKRCQGRTAVAAGQRTLCRECTDCERRTSPAHVAVEWMQPPQLFADGTCPSYLSPDEPEEYAV